MFGWISLGLLIASGLLVGSRSAEADAGALVAILLLGAAIAFCVWIYKPLVEAFPQPGDRNMPPIAELMQPIYGHSTWASAAALGQAGHGFRDQQGSPSERPAPLLGSPTAQALQEAGHGAFFTDPRGNPATTG